VDELDAPRIRVLRQARAHEVRDLSRELVVRLVAGSEDDERLDDGSAPLVWRRDRSSLAHGGKLDTSRRALERPDALAGRDDPVVATACVPDVAVLVHNGSVLAV